MRFSPLFTLLSFVACDIQIEAGDVIREDRAVEAFSRIEASGMLDVEVDVGGPEAVSIVCGEHVLDDIITEVDNSNTLNIRLREGGRWTGIGSCEVHVRVPELTYASAQGSGNLDIDGATSTFATLFSEGSGRVIVTGTAMALEQIRGVGSGGVKVEGIDSRTLVVGLEGSGDVELSGRANVVDLGVDGSGDVDAMDLTTVDADVRLVGSGSVSLTVTGAADVTLTGSGDVELRGNPQVTSNVSGSGNVSVN
ncbi:MAG: hypothetical protein ACJAZO_002721 [Myxococcota bacterium]|jgi:hypothetical protein